MNTKAYNLFNEIVDRLVQTGLTEDEAIYMVAELIESHNQMMKELEESSARENSSHLS